MRTDPPRPDGTPAEVVITWEARRPVTDPTLGIAVTVASHEPCPNRLVTIGDSITSGFQSMAVHRTDLSWPALVAKALGWSGQFRFPTYEGYGGLPLNLELLARQLESKFGTIGWLDSLPAIAWIHQYLNQVEQWWEVDADKTWQPPPGWCHNLAVHGFKLRDATEHTAAVVDAVLAERHDEWLRPMVEHHIDRAARRVLAHAGPDMAVVDVADELGEEGEPGIEALVVALGANHALGSIVRLRYRFTDERYPDDPGNEDYTIWHPAHFAAEWEALISRVRAIKTRHVVLATVPHVTIAPIARGVGGKERPNSRYFTYYTRPWITDSDFQPGLDPFLTGAQARALDSTIDQYNDLITATVAAARSEGRDWYLFDLCGLLDRLAYRRYLSDPDAKPSWWDEAGGDYRLPDEFRALHPVPDTRFFTANENGRLTGGLFSLDGVHPTTIGYGIAAAEVLGVLHRAGMRSAEPGIDFAAVLAADTLVSDPPRSLGHDLRVLGWLDEKTDALRSFWRWVKPG